MNDARPLEDSPCLDDALPVGPAFGQGDTGEPPLICFSHLRWDFVLQRPQHLMNRFGRTRQIYFFEEFIPTDHHSPYLEYHPFEGTEIVSLRPRCAPPSGSLMMRSITPSFCRSCAVRRRASAASRIFSASFHRIEAQPSGEITE